MNCHSMPDVWMASSREKFKINRNTSRGEDVDDSLSSLLSEGANIEKLVDEFNEALTMACNNTFQIHRASRNSPSHRSVLWWSADLTVLRKRTNALRRLYQRTRNNEELTEKRKTEYFECKATYAATIKRKKISSWKEYCDVFHSHQSLGRYLQNSCGEEKHKNSDNYTT